MVIGICGTLAAKIEEYFDVVIVGAGYYNYEQGDQPPWVNTQNYALDKKTIGQGTLEDGFLQFTNSAELMTSEGC